MMIFRIIREHYSTTKHVYSNSLKNDERIYEFLFLFYRRKNAFSANDSIYKNEILFALIFQFKHFVDIKIKLTHFFSSFFIPDIRCHKNLQSCELKKVIGYVPPFHWYPRYVKFIFVVVVF